MDIKTNYKKLILLSVLIMFLGGCLFKNIILNHYIHNKISKIEKRLDLSISYSELSLKGISTLEVKDLSIVPIGKDTLLSINNSDIKLAFLPLLRGVVNIRSFGMSDLNLRFVKNNNGSNFDFLYKKSLSESKSSVDSNLNLSLHVQRLIDMVFNLLPSDATLTNCVIRYDSPKDDLCIKIPDFILQDHKYSTVLNIYENDAHTKMLVSGLIDSRKKEIELNVKAPDNCKVEIPFINYRWNALTSFDSLSLRFNTSQNRNNLLALSGKTIIKGLEMHQHRISPDTVKMGKTDIEFKVNVGKNHIELDSISQFTFNNIHFHPYLKLKKEKDWQITASTNIPYTSSDNFFSSLPSGLFHNLQGIKTSGELSYSFFLDIDFSQLDSLQLYSDLKSRNFRILSYGESNLTKMNSSFEYTAYENDIPVKTFIIGSENPEFSPLGSISRYLPLSIMQNEDAGFFQHNGFILSAIRESLIKDLKEKRFARGGSTISMQLIKNVFLNKNKTISRKLEEMLIVWLIESNRVTSKERMMEVYLNIVEWGPLIYGAHEASKFYFDKVPSDLTLGESIFLASLVPKPKHFKSSFEGTKLRPSLEGFYNIILDRLIQRNLIAPEEAIGVSPETIIFKGEVLKYLESEPSNLLHNISSK